MTLRELRNRAHRTQQEIGNAVNVSQGAVSHWEIGDFPPLRKYRRLLCSALDCTPQELEDAINETVRNYRYANHTR